MKTKHYLSNSSKNKQITFGRNINHASPPTKIETNIIPLQELLSNVVLIGNGLKSIVGLERVRRKQAVILRNLAIPTRTINTHIEYCSVIGYIIFGVVIKVYQRRNRGQIRIVCISDVSVSVPRSDVEVEGVAEELTFDAVAGERDVDPGEGWEEVFAWNLRVVTEDGVEI